MQNLNVGLIGGGFMGKAHSLAYAAMPMFYWPAPALPVRSILAESSDALAAEAARRFGFERAVVVRYQEGTPGTPPSRNSTSLTWPPMVKLRPCRLMP